MFPEKFKNEDNRAVVWVYDMRHPRADMVVRALKEDGVPARHSFKPMSIQPLFRRSPSDLENVMSLYYSDTVFYLHIDPSWTKDDITKIYNKTIKALEKYDI